MPPERFPPDDPREWLNRARSNLAQAKTRLPFPYVHDLARLLTLLEANEAVPDSIRQAKRLSLEERRCGTWLDQDRRPIVFAR